MLLCLLTTSVRAEPSAKQVYDGALADYKAQRFEPAAQGFQHAYELHPLPLLLFNIAQCRRKLGQFVEARAMYVRYLDTAPSTEAAGTLREARGFVADIDAYLAAHDPARRPPGPAPEPTTQPIPLAKAVPVEKPAPVAKPVSVERPSPVAQATTVPASVTLVAKPPAPKRPLRKNPWLWTGVTAGVVAIGLGVGLGIGLTRYHASSDLGTKAASF